MGTLCAICHSPFTPRARTQFLCGQRECRLEHQRRQMRERDRLHREQFGVSYFDRYKVERPCADCGEMFRSKPGASVCLDCQRRRAWRESGASASAAAKRARAEERRRDRGQVVIAGPVRRAETAAFKVARRRLDEAVSGTRSKRAVWVGANCHRCGEPFVCLRTNDLPRWCSRRCLRADSKLRRRQHGGERVAYRRLATFERDRWVCQLCGKRVKRAAKVPDPKAPVIDHIVPLAAGADAGGVDAPWNVQCAHFLCNSIKSATYSAPALF